MLTSNRSQHSQRSENVPIGKEGHAVMETRKREVFMDLSNTSNFLPAHTGAASRGKARLGDDLDDTIMQGTTPARMESMSPVIDWKDTIPPEDRQVTFTQEFIPPVRDDFHDLGDPQFVAEYANPIFVNMNALNKTSATNAVSEGDTLEYHLFNDQLGSAMATLMTSFGLTTMVSAVLNGVGEPSKFSKALIWAFAIIFAVYIGIMAAGYAGYGDGIARYGDIVSAISTSTGKLNWAGYAIIVCILVLCATHFLALFTPVAMDCERLIPEDAPMRHLICYAIRTALVALCALLAVVIPGVMTLISILGAILGMPCVMLLPLFFYWKACFVNTAGLRAIYSGRVVHFTGEILIILLSIYTLVFGLYQTIISL
ncbi:amino acid transporter, putative [Perkinsus marinus ATCC 50983]|uniref:Amino acid transporter, putative n=1 Tax=Perkinsus marinus (strain ATCC 50983 / TXsc) TaxID=423536 RepID=C5KJV6_PERM5|nr:amino acid transporter, putative [Perkinsus marinus ATCC 50983]EER15214.1 amino acid transporter, putative [Perkinsus marinus ATCC 50983]|eukprot:XP_002783418.1 amino acid transporter, putative [Perkinsus marinus ATCC 50983]